MIPTNLTKLNIEFYKIAKKMEISMTYSTEKLIEVNETDRRKFNEFAAEIKKISPNTKILDLIRSKENVCVRGYDITGDKSVYLTDDNYYRKLIGESDLKEDLEIMKENQLSLF